MLTPLKNVTLEMTLKPFKNTQPDAITAVAETVFNQWRNLTDHADVVSILLWVADGSEILDYRGDLEAEMEWARYIGGANPRQHQDTVNDPEGIGLHSRHYLYMDDPPIMTYATLKRIITTLKEVGTARTGKTLRVGATFDPGPEFARSPFKYERHNEICLGGTMGRTSFVCCYGTLNTDDVAYAGFPTGIPQNTPFGTFFGRQCRHFLTDMGFDYIWLSNGFGFGSETWGTTGAIFDGESFKVERVEDIKTQILDFWRMFRIECPGFPIETRGTNLTTGIDLAGDGVPLKAIYEGNFNLLPPPNSPWAALDGDFGLELVGYMSHMAHLPGQDYPFRYYVHDPWWMNSPWLDRYGREPHDIYLPLSVARINADGAIRRPSSIDFLTIDNSLGEMPSKCPNEVIPHILTGLDDAPDAPSPVIWVYPFNEYHEMVEQPERIGEVFFGDWFIRSAVNQGFPLNTVVATDTYVATSSAHPELYTASILVSIVPDAGTALEMALIAAIRHGGKVLLYGPIGNAGSELLEMLGLTVSEPLAGELDLDLTEELDALTLLPYGTRVNHRPLTCAGGIRSTLKAPADMHTHVIASVTDHTTRRVIALHRTLSEWQSGELGWVRGTNNKHYQQGAPLLQSDDDATTYPGELLMRTVLSRLGTTIAVRKREPAVKTPITLISRCRNAFYFSGYTPSTTVALRLRFPQGMPVLMGHDTEIQEGCTVYRMPRAWHHECRIFVEQTADTLLSCNEIAPVEYGARRKIQLIGVQNATIRFYPETGYEDRTRVMLNSGYPHLVGQTLDCETIQDSSSPYIEAREVTGTLTFAW